MRGGSWWWPWWRRWSRRGCCALAWAPTTVAAILPSDEISAAARRLDAGSAPFAVLDKRSAQLAVYRAGGELAGVTPALFGLAPGDHAAPQAAAKVALGEPLLAAERTTPSGRYASVPGRNLDGDRVVWFDYASALAIHRLRPAPAHERRPARLASPSPHDNRITLGCIVVDPAFFDAVVLPVLGRSAGVIVVLPEPRRGPPTR